MRVDRVLLGTAGLLDASTERAIGIPRAANGGRDWHLARAAKPYSLSSALAIVSEHGTMLQKQRDRLEAQLNPANKRLPPAERLPLPSKASLERSLEDLERNARFSWRAIWATQV